MNKKIGLILVVSCMLFLSACSPKAETTTKPQSNISKKAAKTSRTDCMTGCITLWNANKSNAERGEDEMKKDCNSLCDAGQGIQTQDESYCAKAEGVLRDGCYSDIAKNSNKPELCEKIEGSMLISACYASVAEKTGDKSVCEKIPVQIMKESCLSE